MTSVLTASFVSGYSDAVALFLVLAACLKFGRFRRAAEPSSIERMLRLQPAAARLLAAATIGLELALAISILLDGSPLVDGFGLVVLAVTFGSALIATWAFHIPGSCGCLGAAHVSQGDETETAASRRQSLSRVGIIGIGGVLLIAQSFGAGSGGESTDAARRFAALLLVVAMLCVLSRRELLNSPLACAPLMRRVLAARRLRSLELNPAFELARGARRLSVPRLQPQPRCGVIVEYEVAQPAVTRAGASGARERLIFTVTYQGCNVRAVHSVIDVRPWSGTPVA